MPDWLSTYISSNNIRIHYTRTGGDKPYRTGIAGV